MQALIWVYPMDTEIKTCQQSLSLPHKYNRKIMELKGIISVAGHSGLFRSLSQGKNNLIVESLDNGKKMPVYAQTRVSSLEDISIYTDEGEVSLLLVFENIYKKENGGIPSLLNSGNDVLKKYFAEILPHYNREKVYVSDMKKVILWYNQLHKNGLMVFEEEKSKETPESEVTETTE
jgi:hypothetical protein